jgi:hypothetical protein
MAGATSTMAGCCWARPLRLRGWLWFGPVRGTAIVAGEVRGLGSTSAELDVTLREVRSAVRDEVSRALSKLVFHTNTCLSAPPVAKYAPLGEKQVAVASL